MTPEVDTYVTQRLLDAEIGRSHAQLAGEIAATREALSGKIEVLAQAQHDQVAAQDLASRLSSEEHARVQQGLAAMGAKIDGLILSQRTDEAAQAAVSKWRRRFIAAAIAGATIIAPLAAVVLQHLLSQQ